MIKKFRFQNDGERESFQASITPKIFTQRKPLISDLLRELKKGLFTDQRIYADFCNAISKQYRKVERDFAEIDILNFESGNKFDFYLSNDTILNENMKYPVLYLDGELYMSISPMEVQSHINPFLWGNGHILIAGLGLGFIVNQLQEKESVLSIDVIDNDALAIQMYEELFPNHPKVNLIEANFFHFKSEKHYDYFYADIWASRNYARILKEGESVFERRNRKELSFDNYSFWTVEEAIWLELFLGSYKFEELIKKYKIKFGQKQIRQLYKLLKHI